MWVFALAGAARAGDWPTYRGDNARSGGTAEKLATPLAIKWRYLPPAPPRSAWSGPDGRVYEGHDMRDRVKFDDAFHVAVAGDRVYFGASSEHTIYCRDANSGQEVWRFVTGAPVRLAPTIAGGRAFFGSDDGYAYCLDAATGKQIWKLRAGPQDEWLLARGDMISRWPVRTGVLVDGETAYFGAGVFPHEDIYLYAVRATDGKILWKRDDISQEDAGRNDLSPQGYLLADKDYLVVPSGRSLPAVFLRADGGFIHKRIHGWRNAAGGEVGGTKALLADGQIYASGSNHMLALDQKTGDVGFGWFDGRQMAVAGDVAYVATGQYVARIHRLDYAAASRQRHKLEEEISTLSRKLRSPPPNAAELRAKLADLNKRIAETRKVGVQWQRESRLDAAILSAGDLVFVGGENQVLICDAQTGAERGVLSVEGRARGLAAAAGKLFVSTDTGAVYAFGPGQTQEPTPMALEKNPYPKDKLTPVYRQAATDILKRAKTRQGICLVVGAEQGRLAYELAKRSDLTILCVEPDPAKAQAAREALSKAGLYGARVTVHQADLADIPYSDYFANLIVSDSLLTTGKLPGDPGRIARHLKPCGGVVCLGQPEKFPAARAKTDELQSWLEGLKLAGQSEIETDLPWVTLTRGELPGAGSWTGQYANPGNTAVSDEKRVRGGLGVLWYGDPGPGKMVNRHDGAVGPLAAHGRLFVQGENSVMAYDAYNGQFLWERENPTAIRTGVFQNQNPGNLAADENNLFMFMGDKCLQYDAATGAVVREHLLPEAKRDGSHEWGYVCVSDGRLYGTATMREELQRRLRRRGRTTNDATDMIFAVDIASGEHLWAYQGKSVSHYTVAISPTRVFFIDSTITSEQRSQLLREDKTELAKLTGQEAKRAEERMKRLDVRLTVAVDAQTGVKQWAAPVDVTDCSEIGIGGGQLSLMYADGVLLLGGANANGHYWKQFVAGEFSRRRMVALSAEDGSKLWARDANYRHRPIIVGQRVIAEPWAFDLKTGEQQMRPHPLTGKDEPWSIIRPGHHCGMISGCENMLLFRSGYTGFYDLEEDSGTRHFAGHRLGCWINAIPANGLVSIPEASAGCVCLFSIASTIVMEPREARRPWTIYSAVGAAKPVKHMALNFGAPGDRRDAHGQLWLAYPRPEPHKVTSLDLPLNLQQKLLPSGKFISLNDHASDVGQAETPWLYTSWAQGPRQLTLPLRDKDQAPAKYTLTLRFAELRDGVKAGDCRFDVKLQGAAALKDVDIVRQAGGAQRPLELVVKGIEVSGDLVIEFVPKPESAAQPPPILSALQVREE